MLSKVVRLNKSLYGLKQASRTWHAHLTMCLLRLGFEQCLTDVRVFRLTEDGRVTIIAVVHVDDIFAVGWKERCDRLCADLNRAIPVKNLGELKWYGGCRYSRDRERGTLTISQQSFAEELVKKFGVPNDGFLPKDTVKHCFFLLTLTIASDVHCLQYSAVFIPATPNDWGLPQPLV